MLKKYVFLSAEKERYLKKIWRESTRPTTVILKHRALLPRILTGKTDSLALRLPKSKFLIKMIKELDEPIVSTSLNLSYQPIISDPTNLRQYFTTKLLPDLVVNNGPCRRLKASRLVDLSSEGRPVILRK
jgi:tRNA A37 threonylcarbamoyladenosine synthetase subunit TsaC/SUA5/YrdC